MGGSPYGSAPQPGSDTPKILGIVSLVAGIIGIPASCCCWFLGWIPVVVALATGAISLVQGKDDPYPEGRPFAIAGIILGVIGLLCVAASIIWVVVSGTNTWDSY